MPLGIHGIHDVPVFCCNAVVSLLVTAAKVFVVRAELQGQRGLERQPIIQILRMSQQSACQAQQGEANTHMWTRKRNSRAAAALSRLWPSIHFLQYRLLEVKCIEILDSFIAWFINFLCFVNCQSQSSAFPDVCLHSLFLSLRSSLLGSRDTLQAASLVLHMSQGWTLPLDISPAPRSTHKSNPYTLG